MTNDMSRQAALLTIGGLDLDPLLGKGGLDGIMNWEGDRQEMRGAAAALGYLAAAVERLAFYLDVPLRYPIKPGNCKTLILSHAVAAGSYRSVSVHSASLHASLCTMSCTILFVVFPTCVQPKEIYSTVQYSESCTTLTAACIWTVGQCLE